MGVSKDGYAKVVDDEYMYTHTTKYVYAYKHTSHIHTNIHTQT